MENDSLNKVPLSVIILSFEKYNFDFFTNDEVLFFEWLVVKSKSFGLKEFYHSAKQIHDQIGIKRDRLIVIQGKFVHLKIIDLIAKPPNGGFGNVTHYYVNHAKIVELLPEIYKLSENRKPFTEYLQPLWEYHKLLSELQHNRIIKQNSNRTLSENKEKKGHESENFVFSLNGNKTLTDQQIRDVGYLLERLGNDFAERKQLALDNGQTARKNYTFNPSKQVKLKIAEARQQYPDQAIIDAFVVFSDSVLKQEIFVKKNLMEYFFSTDSEGSFDVIETFNTKFALHYHMTSKKSK